MLTFYFRDAVTIDGVAVMSHESTHWRDFTDFNGGWTKIYWEGGHAVIPFSNITHWVVVESA